MIVLLTINIYTNLMRKMLRLSRQICVNLKRDYQDGTTDYVDVKSGKLVQRISDSGETLPEPIETNVVINSIDFNISVLV